MPAILTHDFFGRSLAEDARALLSLRSAAERDAFLLGNQGPDPLFYLLVDPLMHKWSPLGGAMHDSSPADLLPAMREAATRLEGHERQIARAYVAGFACHWVLDSTMHPFVYFWQNGITSAGVEGLDAGSASKVHAEIERDFDEMVLFSATGKTVERWRPHEHVLAASHATLAAIDKLYFYVALWVFGRPIDPRTFSTAVLEFRLVQRAFDSPTGRKRSVIGQLERFATRSPFSLVNAMSHRARPEATSAFDNRDHRPWENPFTHEVATTGFWDLYEDARTRALPVLADLLLSEDLDLAAASELTHDLNFEGKPTKPGEKVTW